MTEQPTNSAASTRRGAVRLIFQYEGRQLRLLSREQIDMLAPPTDLLAGHESYQGFWVEVRDPDGLVLHRRIMPDPMKAAVEVFSNEPGASLRQVPVNQPQGTFAVLVPELEHADHLAIMRSAVGEGEQRTTLAATELARFPLTGNGQAGGS
jgi:hypothetical protein